MTDDSKPLFLILSELKMILRHPRLVEHPHELGLTPILVHSKGEDTARLRALMADPEHPFAKLGGLHRVAGPTVDAVVGGVCGPTGLADVRGLLSCGEYYVEQAGALAHVLGLPGAGWPAATISRNKLLQRCALPEYAPRWQVVGPRDRTDLQPDGPDWNGPLVVKPTTRMSSSGVRELSSGANLNAVLAQYPANETLLVEERVTGPEFSVETLVQQGVPVWSGITAKETNEGAGAFVETAHTVPAAGLDPAQAAELTDTNTEVLRRLGFQDGVAHAEYRLTEHGMVLMEVAVRLPGGGITVLWHLATGRCLEDTIVDLALGRPASYPQPARQARHEFLAHPAGKLAEVHSRDAPVTWTTRDGRWPTAEPAAPGAPARAFAVLVSKQAGDELGALVDGDARAVSVIVDAPLDQDIGQEAKRARDGVDIIVA